MFTDLHVLHCIIQETTINQTVYNTNKIVKTTVLTILLEVHHTVTFVSIIKKDVYVTSKQYGRLNHDGIW